MSVKATAVSTVFAPKTQKGYLVIVPNVFHTILLASRADYPKTPLNTTKINVFGNDYTIPLRGKTDNNYTITIPEGSFSEIEFEIDSLLAKQANYGYRKGNNLATFDIFVCPYTGVPPQMVSGALAEVDSYLSGASDSVQQIIQQVSSILGQVVVGDSTPLATEWKTLKGCTLIDYKPDGFNSSGRDAVQNWNLTFHYTTISPLIPMPFVGQNLTKKSYGSRLETGSVGSMWDGPLFSMRRPSTSKTEVTYEDGGKRLLEYNPYNRKHV